ncbi:aminotransferase class I/II-fold pyridoxal phosphate-dependent enzyme [Nesterenkonia lutea]|uniref:N-succinyldiaminopimelate aminotransferase n=1 Tax=Nesterenkonia lutea TaxID=272919 RepID=A0ABR9JE05_9MICC|nr:aminotransferase class I/II-fold pyridoxal phosphate-dependent enzyme [Nesterenkonia lutea]MBE1524167.1 N-succinyldiaminopimelate aminotransferase [Nesterenkonia lutea]
MSSHPSRRPDPLALDQPWARTAAGANTLDPASSLAAPRVVPTIYERTTAAAIAHGAINLGQGFPDTEGPDWLLELAARAITDPGSGPRNQYAPGMGLPELRAAVSSAQQRRQGVTLDPENQVMVTTGATEGISATILAFARPGSEVLTFEPHYDSYGACVALAGARMVGVPLRGPAFRPDVDALEAAITERTSMILVNTPHNPTGTVFSAEELRRIVELARKHDLRIMCDEVYERLVLSDAALPHRSILTVPGAQDVAVAVGSAGKSFSVTGWKVGWVTGSAELISQVRGVKQFLSFSSGPAFQWAVAQGLDDDRGFFAANTTELEVGRDLLSTGLTELGLAPNAAEAGYFVLGDVSGITSLSAVDFCAILAEEVGVAAIPVSALTIQHRAEPTDELQRLVRFAFCKDHATIAEGLRRMRERLPAALSGHPPSLEPSLAVGRP